MYRPPTMVTQAHNEEKMADLNPETPTYSLTSSPEAPVLVDAVATSDGYINNYYVNAGDTICDLDKSFVSKTGWLALKENYEPPVVKKPGLQADGTAYIEVAPVPKLAVPNIVPGS